MLDLADQLPCTRKAFVRLLCQQAFNQRLIGLEAGRQRRYGLVPVTLEDRFGVAGVVLVAVGLLLYVLPPTFPLGRLPGDIRIERPGLRFYFPITTCVLVSAVLTAAFWLLSKLR